MRDSGSGGGPALPLGARASLKAEAYPQRRDKPPAWELSQERDGWAVAMLENFQGNVGFEPEQGKVENVGFLGMGNKMQRFLDAALELWTTKPRLIGFCSQPQAPSGQGWVFLPHWHGTGSDHGPASSQGAWKRRWCSHSPGVTGWMASRHDSDVGIFTPRPREGTVLQDGISRRWVKISS